MAGIYIGTLKPNATRREMEDTTGYLHASSAELLSCQPTSLISAPCIISQRQIWPCHVLSRLVLSYRAIAHCLLDPSLSCPTPVFRISTLPPNHTRDIHEHIALEHPNQRTSLQSPIWLLVLRPCRRLDLSDGGGRRLPPKGLPHRHYQIVRSPHRPRGTRGPRQAFRPTLVLNLYLQSLALRPVCHCQDHPRRIGAAAGQAQG